MNFRYRYVGFGTTFEHRDGIRSTKDADPAFLFENEIALDIGGVCWGYAGETLPVIDHHFQREEQFPSAAAAVLHHAPLILQKFDPHKTDLIWLVAHEQPDFDAFCSMYLVRCILEHRIDPNVHTLLTDPRAFNWFFPNLTDIPFASRWHLLLASYASHIDNGRRISCPKQRALHSVLYSALRRGRDYLSETSGAMEFFDEVRTVMEERQLNPLYDSVLESSTRFQPELTLLDGEVEAYRRDVLRAKKSIVYLQKLSTPYEPFFSMVEQEALLNAKLEPVAPHIASPDEAREEADAIYLKDPECLLFKEWARLDLENSLMGAGFTFTAVAYSGGRKNMLNQTDYFFSLDLERARGRHLYALWAHLEAAEVQALHRPENKVLKQQLDEAERAAANTIKRTNCRLHFLERAGAYKALFNDPWFDGNNYKSTIIATPTRGTFIGPAGQRVDLTDDPVVQIVRQELENSIYISPYTILDQAASNKLPALPPKSIAITHVPEAPAEGCFRFAQIALNSGVSLLFPHIAQQVGETLWQALHPDAHGSTPADFLTRHLMINPEWIGVWSRRGIVLAFKPTGKERAEAVEHRFRQMIALVGRVEAFIEPGTKPMQDVVDEGELLTRDAARLAYELTLPESRLLSRFFEALGLRELLIALRDLNMTAAEQVRQETLSQHTKAIEQRDMNLAEAEQARQETLIEHFKTVAGVQVKLEMLEVLIFAIYGGELGHLLLPETHTIWMQLLFVLGGSGIGVVLGFLILKPSWEHFLAHWRGDHKSHSLPHAQERPLPPGKEHTINGEGKAQTPPKP